jgi:hypothetical protein
MVLHDVQAHGARAAVAALWANTERWNQAMAEIARGSGEWLQVAAALHPGTDAGASEELEEAIFLAIKQNPQEVLGLLKARSFAVSAVCNGNVADDYTAAQSKRFLMQRIQTLKARSDPATSGVRDQCLAGLRSALATLR